MGIVSVARSVLAISFPKALAILAVCVGVELLACAYGLIPRLERDLIWMADKYDAYFPEITIQDGRASIKEKQPYYIENFGDSGVVLIIDTTVSSYDDALKYLKNVGYGAMLTRSAIVNKDGSGIKVVSLKDAPDMVINSENIRKAIDRLSPIVKTWGLAFLAVFFLLTKLLQALSMALIPFLGARLFHNPLPFEYAFKLAVVCMVVPVGINFFLSFSEMSIASMLMVYYTAFAATVILVTRDYLEETRRLASQ